MQFRRNQDFYISSIVQLNCNTSVDVDVHLQWLIDNCSTSNCFDSFRIDSSVKTTLNELYIPAQTLPLGIYQLKLTVTMTISSALTTSKSVYVQINPSGITANLVLLGTSMITSGAEQDLQLNPGNDSIDLDHPHRFNASDWNYQYFCRLYSVSSVQQPLLPLDDPRYSPCADNQTGHRQLKLKYTGVNDSVQSALTILGGSLQPNRTYQWMVQMENKRNQSLQGTGYLLVQVDETFPQLISIRCVITSLCIANMEFQHINPTTQIALYALCPGNCSQLRNITWKIYRGEIDPLLNESTRWIPFNRTDLLERNRWFFGSNTSDFTATKELFVSNPQITRWRFEAAYSFPSEISSSSLNFVINPPPRNGSCSIDRTTGTVSTPFTVSCPGWFDEDEIQDYSLLAWAAEPSERTLIAFSLDSTFEVYLPAGPSPLQMLISIRDGRDCVTEWKNLSSIVVRPDPDVLDDLLKMVNQESTSNPLIQLLKTGNQNQVGQVISSLAQQINQLDEKSLEQAFSAGIPLTTISVSSLGASPTGDSSSLNSSVWEEFESGLNRQAKIREYLLGVNTRLSINTMNSIQLQAKSLKELTESTHQLTRSLLLAASNRSLALVKVFHSKSESISTEEAQMTANQLLQCATNLLTAVNGPLQERTRVLRADLLESEGDENRNLRSQEHLASRVSEQMTEVFSLVTKALKIHLNLDQSFQLNSSAVFFTLETVKIESLVGKEIQSVGDARLRFPSRSLDGNVTRQYSLRSTLEPLAAFGQSPSASSNTSLSRSMSLTLLDENGREIPLTTTKDQPFEMIIPRDPSYRIPAMFLQNVTAEDLRLFKFHQVDLMEMSSIHLELQPLDINLSYAFIYYFDHSRQPIEGWTIFCPPIDLTADHLYRYFLDNEQTANHQSLIFGLRELNSTEMNQFCSSKDLPTFTERAIFTLNYRLRLYTSSCLYFDQKDERWKSDGMRVGSLTNHMQTQCFSTHLTSFTSGFAVLPEPLHYSDTFNQQGPPTNRTTSSMLAFSVTSIFTDRCSNYFA